MNSYSYYGANLLWCLLTYPFHPQWDLNLQHQSSSTGSCPLLRPEHRTTRAPYLVALPLLSFAMLSLIALASFFRVVSILGQLSLAILRTCPSHLSRRRLISKTALLQAVFLWSFILAILSGQTIRQIFLKHPLVEGVDRCHVPFNHSPAL